MSIVSRLETILYVVLFALTVTGCGQRTVSACCDVHEAPCSSKEVPFSIESAGEHVDMCSSCFLAGAIQMARLAGVNPLVCVP